MGKLRHRERSHTCQERHWDQPQALSEARRKGSGAPGRAWKELEGTSASELEQALSSNLVKPEEAGSPAPGAHRFICLMNLS